MSPQSLKALEAKFTPYFAIGEAIATLMYPFAEVVLHDLGSGRVVRLWNAFSARKAGDPSHLEGASDLFTQDNVLGPYEKALSSQGRTKSITAALRDDEGTIIGYFCVNLEVTIIDTAVSKIRAFTQISGERPKPLYLNDFEQQIHFAVRDYLMAVNKSLDVLSRQERVGLIAQIEDSGLFHARNSVRFVANALGISRASVYNHLTEAKTQRESGELAPPEPATAARPDHINRASAIASAQAQAHGKRLPPPARKSRTKRA